ncbi:Uncharacterised protein [Vibrio cholerae]|nr:Uncharacterised protein [Vibrio cholerae]
MSICAEFCAESSASTNSLSLEIRWGMWAYLSKVATIWLEKRSSCD